MCVCVHMNSLPLEAREMLVPRSWSSVFGCMVWMLETEIRSSVGRHEQLAREPHR